jgi:hypothetical protein
MITEKNHKLLTSQIFLTDCTKKGLASMGILNLSRLVTEEMNRKSLEGDPKPRKVSNRFLKMPELIMVSEMAETTFLSNETWILPKFATSCYHGRFLVCFILFSGVNKSAILYVTILLMVGHFNHRLTGLVCRQTYLDNGQVRMSE